MQNYDLFQICAMIWGVFGREGLIIDVWTNNAGGVWRGGVRGKKWGPAMETERKRFVYPVENEYIYIDSTNNIEPLKIGSKFKVNWRGEVTASYITASGGK